MTGSRLRIGLAGLGHWGSHQFERIALRNDLDVTAAYDPDSKWSGHLLSNGVPIYPRFDSLIDRNDLDFVLIATPLETRAQLAVAAHEAGKNAAIVPPPCLSSAEFQNMIAASRRTGGRLCVIPERRDGVDFRSALHAVQSGALGEVRAGRLLSWDKAIPANQPADAGDEEAFIFFAFQYVDQLLKLIDEIPHHVVAHVDSPSPSRRTATAFALTVGFEDGRTGSIDVNLSSAASVHTGWILAGASAGYHAQRVYSEDPGGEIVDAPVMQPESSQFDVYAELLDSTLGAGPAPSALCAAKVMMIIDCARKSAAIGQVVRIEPS